LLALLNSRVSEFYARIVFVGKQNSYYEVQPEGLEAFPIPPATESQKAAIVERVEKILAAHQQPHPHPNPPLEGEGAYIDVTQLEAEIDQLVYSLYNLTEDEIAIVEGKRSTL